MPLKLLKFRPGINREGTTLTNEGGWFDGDKVRFRSGNAEKIGGWDKDTGAAYNSGSTYLPTTGSFWGVCRSMWNWVTLAFYNLTGLGTNLKFYIQNGVGGYFYDVTPIRETTPAGAVTFTAYNGLSTVLVTDSAHNAVAGDFVTFSGAVSLGGNITAAVLNQEYQITAIISNNTYTITARNTSGATVTANASDTGNGGAATIGAYQINTGSDVATTAPGWGAGGWGGATTVAATTTVYTGGVTAVATTINVNSVSGFAASGTILIDSEVITYTSVTAGTPSTFNGCTRGFGGAAVAHSAGATVYQFPSTSTGWGAAAPAGLGLAVQLRLWSQANYGENLVLNPRGGPLYYWVVNNPTTTFNRAQILASTNTNTQPSTSGTAAWWQTDAFCPSLCNFVMVSDASRFVIAFGCNDPTGTYATTALDPMQIRWSDQENILVWQPNLATNQAGDIRLSHGSQIVTALQSRQEILVWTDASLYSMQYLGPPYIWGTQLLADNLSITSPNAAVAVNNVVYWMGVDKFYMYTGRVETLPCTVRQYVFQNINLDQQYQFFGGTNEGFSEIWWFYCSAGSEVIDRYVIYNHLEQIWYYGSMQRTAWCDSPLRNYPMASGYNGQLIYHENGDDDGSTNPPSPINSYIQSSDFDIDQGDRYGFVYRLIPDVNFDGSTTNNPTAYITMLPRTNPGANYTTTNNNPPVISTQNYTSTPSYLVQQFTEIIYVRARGRQMALKVSSTAGGVQWQLGAVRLDIRPDGRR
jgi:hypothetical protein